MGLTQSMSCSDFLLLDTKSCVDWEENSEAFAASKWVEASLVLGGGRVLAQALRGVGEKLKSKAELQPKLWMRFGCAMQNGDDSEARPTQSQDAAASSGAGTVSTAKTRPPPWSGVVVPETRVHGPISVGRLFSRCPTCVCVCARARVLVFS